MQNTRNTTKDELEKYATWGGGHVAGRYQQLPHALSRNLGTLGISGTEFAFLVAVASHHCKEGSVSFVGRDRIARYLGVTPRAVKRVRQSLEKKGLIRCVARFRPLSTKAGAVEKRQERKSRGVGRQTSNAWDLSPLLAKLNALETRQPQAVPDFPASEGDFSGPPRGDQSDPDMGDQIGPPVGDQDVPLRNFSIGEEQPIEDQTRESNESGSASRSQTSTGIVRTGQKSSECPSAKISSSRAASSARSDPKGGQMSRRADAARDAAAKAIAKTHAELDAGAKRRAERERRRQNLSGEDRRPISRQRFTKDLYRVWKPRFAELFPDVEVPGWGAKERGQLDRLVERHGQKVTEIAVRYLITNWAEIYSEFFRDKEELGVPTLGFLLRFDDQLVVKAQRWEKDGGDDLENRTVSPQERLRRAGEAWDAWLEAHPDSDPSDIPDPIREEFAEAQRAAKSTGRV